MNPSDPPKIIQVLESTNATPTKPSLEGQGLASNHPSLTDEERQRVLMCEYALIRLYDLAQWRSQDLFPDIKMGSSGSHWSRDFLRRITSAGVVTRSGSKSGTKYVGLKDRIEKLIDDPEWLLKLIVPSALARTSRSEIDSQDDEPEDNQNDELKDPIQAFYEVLTYQHERIANIEKILGELNMKLDSITDMLKARNINHKDQ